MTVCRLQSEFSHFSGSSDSEERAGRLTPHGTTVVNVHVRRWQCVKGPLLGSVVCVAGFKFVKVREMSLVVLGGGVGGVGAGLCVGVVGG